MSNPTNSLVDEFENSFQTCLSALTNPDSNHIHDSDEIKTSVELTIQRFLDVARQMECFFLQKRLLLSQQKPELVLYEDNNELRAEIARKDQVLQKFHEKLAVWQNVLSETGMSQSNANVGTLSRQTSLGQQQGVPTSPHPLTPTSLSLSLSNATIPSPMRHQTPPMNQPSLLQAAMSSPMTPPQAGPLSSMNMPNVAPGVGMMQMPQMQNQMMSGGVVPGQQQAPGNMMAPGGQMHSQFVPQPPPHASGLQGPLAYLERTTSNIGMPDPRR